jgi:hypothetical protein
MRYFDRGFGFRLKKYLSVTLSISIVTLAMPMKSSAADINVQNQLPTLSEEQIARPPYGKITEIIINYSFGNNIDMDIPLNMKAFHAEAWARLENGKFLAGEELEKICDGISWDIMNPIMANVIGLPRKAGHAIVRVPVEKGSGYAWVSATCNNSDAVKGGYKSGNVSGRKYLRGEGIGVSPSTSQSSTQAPVKSSVSSGDILLWSGIGLGVAGTAALVVGIALGGSGSGSSYVAPSCEHAKVSGVCNCTSIDIYTCSDQKKYYRSSDGKYETTHCALTDSSCLANADQAMNDYCCKTL